MIQAHRSLPVVSFISWIKGRRKLCHRPLLCSFPDLSLGNIFFNLVVHLAKSGILRSRPPFSSASKNHSTRSLTIPVSGEAVSNFSVHTTSRYPLPISPVLVRFALPIWTTKPFWHWERTALAWIGTPATQRNTWGPCPPSFAFRVRTRPLQRPVSSAHRLATIGSYSYVETRHQLQPPASSILSFSLSH